MGDESIDFDMDAMEMEDQDLPVYVNDVPVTPTTPVPFKLRSLQIYLIGPEDTFPIKWLLGNSHASLKYLDANFRDFLYLTRLRTALTPLSEVRWEGLILHSEPELDGSELREGEITKMFELCPDLVQFGTRLCIETNGTSERPDQIVMEAINSFVRLLAHLRFNVYSFHYTADSRTDPCLDPLALLINAHDPRTADLETITFQWQWAYENADALLDALMSKKEEKLFEACKNRGIEVRMLPHDVHTK